jgi:hypothetical protein
MRRLERWLHQHIFKVGWLLTRKMQTTTILYYTFFLPGVVLNEVVYWLVAGIINVRAERAIAWPEAQAIAELKLNFIRLAKNTSRVKVAIISIAPLLSGLALIYIISNNVLNLNLVLAVGSGGTLDDYLAALRLLLGTPDVWLWVYLMFTIANTMFPNRDVFKGWRPVVMALAVAVVALYVVGVGQQLFLQNLALPITDGLSRLALIFVVIIVIDLIVTGVLGTIEANIERITGYSATFEKGKLVALTKEDVQRLREQQRAKREKERQAAKAPKPARSQSGPPSIYKLPLPIPGAPGKEALEPALVSSVSKPASPAAAMPPLTGRAGPAMITGTAVVKSDDELKPDRPLQEAKIDLPSSFVKQHTPEPEDEEDENDLNSALEALNKSLSNNQGNKDESGEADEADEIDEDEEEERL